MLTLYSFRPLLAGAFFLLATAPGAFAGTLGTWHGHVSTNPGGSQADGSFEIIIQIGNGCPFSSLCDTIFNRWVTPSDVGATFTLDSSSQPDPSPFMCYVSCSPPDFNGAASLLTNGAADNLFQQGYSPHGGGGGNGAPENQRFSLPAGVTDFAGNTISDIQIKILSVAFNNFNGGFWSAGYDLTVNGAAGAATTPEPATLFPAAAGILALALCRFWPNAGVRPEGRHDQQQDHARHG